MTRIQWGMLIVAGALAGCSASGSDPGDNNNNTAVDDFAVVPAAQPGETMEWHLPDQIIPAGKEKMFCYYQEVLDSETYLKTFRSYQGQSGHHLILFSAVVPQAPGTVEDCSDMEDMVRYRPIISNERFGIDEFPEGMALYVKRGTQLVLQQHVVNASAHDVRVRDVARASPAPESSVDTLVGFMGLADISFKIPPGQQQKVSFDCTVPYDANILVLGPHMHEWGTKFSTTMGPSAGPQETLIDVPVWTAEYRDEPPVTMYSQTNPKAMRGGDVIHTECTFHNTSDGELGFPSEMCATFGYFYPAHKDDSEFICAGSSAD